jgi:hypothetical protein
MSTETLEQQGLYYTIIDGTFRRRVPEGTPGAIRREYETKDGAKGEKYEMVIDALEGTIEDMIIVEGDYGRQLSITLDKNVDGVNPKLQFGVETTYGEDVLKKLPAVDFTQPVKFRPFNFTDQSTGKEVRGVEMKQGDNKLQNFFWDYDAKKAINGAPEFTGDKDSKDDWKVHFLTVRKFLVGYFHEKVQPKLGKPAATSEARELEADEVPF